MKFVKVAVSHDFCHSDKMNVLMNGLKLLNGTSNVDMFKFRVFGFSISGFIAIYINMTWEPTKENFLSFSNFMMFFQ